MAPTRGNKSKKRKRLTEENKSQEEEDDGFEGNMKRRFYDFENHPKTAFTGNKKLLVKGAKNKKKASDWLSRQTAFNLHVPAPSRKGAYRRTKTVAGGLDFQWQVDLSDMQSLKKYNNGFAYILNAVDVLSRYAWSRPLKTKEGSEVARALEDIFTESGRHPLYHLQSDLGKEFFNKKVKALASKYKFEQFHTADREVKCALVERLNKTLKQLIWRYFSWSNTRQWIKVLPHLVKGYNLRPHSAHGLPPASVTVENQDEVFQTLYPQHTQKEQEKIKKDYKKIGVGDYVLLLTDPGPIFRKGFLPKWSREPFQVWKRVVKTPRAVFYLRDLSGEDVTGSWLSDQLQRIDQPPKDRLIEKVLKKQGGRALVKWMGYDNKWNSYITLAELKRYHDIDLGQTKHVT